MKIGLTIIYSLYLSFFRRWFGGGFDKLPDNRAFQNCLNVVITFGYLFFCGVGIWRSFIASLCLQFLYFCPAHGAAFDIGRAGKPDSEMIKRYERYFWDKWCKFIVPEKCWYGFWYDYLWMMFRYGIPAVLISAVLGDWLFGYAGFGVATTYAVCWSLYDKGKIKKPTDLAEYVAGFISGLLL